MTIDTAGIGPYEIEEVVTEHESTQVLRCRDPVLDRVVAIKTVRPGADGADRVCRRLLKEARLRSALDHCHLLPLYSVETTPAGPALVGPWLGGGSLVDRCQGRVTIELLVRVLRAIGSALDALHAAGWVHCDLNFHNVRFARDGRPVLIDLGSARRIGEPWVRGSEPAEVTPRFMPPEGWRGEPLVEASDVYSLGVFLYLGLTGSFPFEGEDVESFRRKHCTEPLPPPSSRSPLVGAALDEVVSRSLSKDPRARYASGTELAAAFEAALEGDGLRRPPEGARTEPRPESADESSVASLEVGPKLKAFENSLGEDERAALQVLLARARHFQGQAREELSDLTSRLFAVPAAVLALEGSGAAAAVARGARTVREVARACDAPEWTLARLLETLTAADLVVRNGEEYSLPPYLEVFYQDAHRLGAVATPLAEGSSFWNHLSHWVRTGEPRVRMDRPDGSRYAPIVNRFGGRFAAPARRLASELTREHDLPQGPEILDVGAGSAAWSLAFAMLDPEASITAVDRAGVLETTRANAEAAGVADRLKLLPGDWRDVSLPPRTFDLALVANLCHLETEADAARLIERVEPALAPGGLLVVVDRVPEDGTSAALPLQLFSLRVALRTTGGELHDLARYRRWFDRAGLDPDRRILLQDAAEGLTALIARCRAA